MAMARRNSATGENAVQPRWPHQIRGVVETIAALARGERCILLTSPTGGGKSRMACDLIEHWLDDGLKVSVYTNRRLLVDQLAGVLQAHGINHGIRAAGHASDHDQAVQISSMQTEDARSMKKKQWTLHKADRVLIDEAHLQAHPTAQAIARAHVEVGAALVGLTATPIGLAGMYDVLIQAGINSELRECGALVRCLHYGPDEPDLRHIGKVQVGEELTEKQNVKAIMVPGIFGRVLEWYRRLNPEGKPSILFGPGVKESLWFAEQFQAAGVASAHIDGQDVWVKGKLYHTSPEARADVLEGSKDGRIRLLCNRFVLREGVDAPWLAHGIFAAVFGALQSYLQSGGRLLRSHPGLAAVTLQDHGGNWWRHGSLNADRIWDLSWTPTIVSGIREDRLRNGQEREPLLCPRCKCVLGGSRCACGWEAPPGSPASRPVIQADGEAIDLEGRIYKPRRISRKPNGPALWKRMYFRSRTEKGAHTFRAAMALFAAENNWGWPDPSWPFMPIDPFDNFRLVADVPSDRLVPEGGKT